MLKQLLLAGLAVAATPSAAADPKNYKDIKDRVEV